jgi:hypothetical protein
MDENLREISNKVILRAYYFVLLTKIYPCSIEYKRYLNSDCRLKSPGYEVKLSDANLPLQY